MQGRANHVHEQSGSEGYSRALAGAIQEAAYDLAPGLYQLLGHRGLGQAQLGGPPPNRDLFWHLVPAILVSYLDYPVLLQGIYTDLDWMGAHELALLDQRVLGG